MPVLRAGRRGVRQRYTAVTAATVGLALALGACSSPSGSAGTPSGTESATQAGNVSPSPSASPTAPAPVVTVAGGPKVAYGKPVRLSVEGGQFSSVTVQTAAGAALDGEIGLDSITWKSQEAPKPGTKYVVQAVVKDAVGTNQDAAAKFTVTPVPDDKKLTYTVTPQAGSTVGIAQPIVVRFLSPVTERKAVESKLLVDAKAPNGSAVEGRWHWLNAQQVDWRPKKFWTPGTKVDLQMSLAGVKASQTRYGRKDYSQKFTIGASRVLKVDLKRLTAKLYHGDKLVGTWPTGGGKAGLATYSGTYVVLDKAPVVEMDSCSAGITCDKKDPDYYSDPEYWATRLTRSGTFVHAADWDPLIGRANVSHGCIHLSGRNAKKFFDQAQPGDAVIVSNSGRGPQERIDSQDPGLYDWNIPWKAWVKGSAL
jgi:lipoprotein-anchoring transpeptidase ErfK/SrfK